MPEPIENRKRARRLGRAVGVVCALGAAALFAPAAAPIADLPVPLLTAEAHAATYTVHSCNNGVNHAWGSYWNSGVSNITLGAACPGAFGAANPALTYNSGLFVRNVSNTSYSPSGALGGLKLTAPAGNSLASIAGDWWFTRAAGSGFYSTMLGDWSLITGCWASSAACGYYFPNSSFPLNGSSEVRIEVGCSNPPPGCYANNTNEAIFEVYRADVVVNDNTQPAVSPSGSLWTGNWISGAKSVTVSGSDGSDGIQRNDLNIDGRNIAMQGHGCDFSYMTPCPTSAGDTFTYDTHQLSDGRHSIQAVTYDAGWLGGSADGTIYVDNHAPTRVGPPTVAGGQTWHTTNSFDVSWKNPAQDSGSPIAAAHYSLCLASDPTNCPVTDKRVAAAGISSLSGITVPAPGDYLLKVWDEDAAGNDNASTASDPVHLMFDNVAPGAADPAHANGWINAQDAKSYSEPIDLKPLAKLAKPVSGIKGYSITLDGSKPDATVEALGEKLTYNIAEVPEGHNLLTARAVSNAGVAAADSDLGTAELDVDKTPPTTAAAGAPSPDQWQTRQVTIDLTGTDQPSLSGMAGAPDSDPTVTDGAYIAYRIDGGSAQRARGGQVSVPVTSDGEHTLAYQAYDLAGNPSAEQSVSFKLDRTAPELVAFAARDAQDPRALAVLASDRTSGVAGGVIEIRKVGSNSWTPLDTTKTSDDHFAARLDESELDRNATYEARARVRDVAGNEAIGSAYQNGAPVMFSGGLREQTKVSAQFTSPRCSATKKPARHHKHHTKRAAAAKAKKHRRHKKRAAACAKPRRHAKRTAPVPRKRHTHKKAAVKRPTNSPTDRLVPFGQRARITGTLTTATGAPIANADLTVDAELTMVGAGPHREAVVRTDSSGRFAYDAPAGASRTLSADYEGSNVLLPGSGSVTLRVPASAVFTSTPRRVRLHQRVTFSGKLRTLGAPVPAVGKLVALEAFDRGKWRKFAVLRTRPDGSFSYRFAFEAPGSQGVTYPIKLVLPREAGYAFDSGQSKPVKVTVKR
jgi:hypothetical protein